MATQDPADPSGAGLDAATRAGGSRTPLPGREDEPVVAPDTTAYGAEAAAELLEKVLQEKALQEKALQEKVLSPRGQRRPVSPLEGLGAVPVMSVSRTALPAAPPPAAELPTQPEPLTRVAVLSAPGPDQVCPTCKKPLRVIRTRREDRLECTWFRLEWLEVDRGWADCPLHPQVETVALHRPAFLEPRAPLANGMLARMATWRWQDFMLGQDITRILVGLGLSCSDSQVARWMLAGGEAVSPVAAQIRAELAGQPGDRLGVVLVDGSRAGRLRACAGPKAVAYTWTEEAEGPERDQPGELARELLLRRRGLCRTGRQADLRRAVARATATDGDRSARAAWRLEELRTAPDAATEQRALQRAIEVLGGPDLGDRHLKGAGRTLVTGQAELCRFLPDGSLAPDLPLPENVRGRLRPWHITPADDGPERVADWLTVVESCSMVGLSTWRYLRDLFTEHADRGGVDPARWTPAARVG